MSFAIELRTVYGKSIWNVLSLDGPRACTIARCDTRENAMLVCNALTQAAQVDGPKQQGGGK